MSRRREVFEALLIGGLAVLALAEVAANESVRDRWQVTLTATLVLIGCAAARRREPWWAAVVAGITYGVQALLGGRADGEMFTAVVAALLVVHAVAARRSLRPALTGGAAVLSGLLGGIALQGNVFDALLAAIVLGASWSAGRVAHRLQAQTVELASLAARLEAEQERRARDAALHERARIARDLHDVVAHHVSVMVVQAGGARGALHSDTAAAAEALRAVEDTGRSALIEMRRLLGVLREQVPERTPQPGLGDLATLVASGDELSVLGEPREVDPGLDLTAYRVLQEALTNARRHGHPPVHVCVAWSDNELRLSVRNSALDGEEREHGHGLVGMRERVHLYDGTMSAGPDGAGDWLVAVSLPLAATGVRA